MTETVLAIVATLALIGGATVVRWIKSPPSGAGSSFASLMRPRGYSPYAGSTGPGEAKEKRE